MEEIRDCFGKSAITYASLLGDLSKKRRIVNKMKGNAGVPLSPPPYGCIKNPDDPCFWVVGPEAAEVVRRIYRMALEGYGLAETAAQLAADGVVNPTYYWRSRGTSRGGSKSTVEPTKWGHTTVKKILTLQEYCGDVINFKSYSKSYKMKKRIENPEENRAIFLNVHEAPISACSARVCSNPCGQKRFPLKRTGSVFYVQGVCIVTLGRGLCKWFLRGSNSKIEPL